MINFGLGIFTINANILREYESKPIFFLSLIKVFFFFQDNVLNIPFKHIQSNFNVVIEGTISFVIH